MSAIELVVIRGRQARNRGERKNHSSNEKANAHARSTCVRTCDSRRNSSTWPEALYGPASGVFTLRQPKWSFQLRPIELGGLLNLVLRQQELPPLGQVLAQ